MFQGGKEGGEEGGGKVGVVRGSLYRSIVSPEYVMIVSIQYRYRTAPRREDSRSPLSMLPPLSLQLFIK